MSVAGLPWITETRAFAGLVLRSFAGRSPDQPAPAADPKRSLTLVNRPLSEP